MDTEKSEVLDASETPQQEETGMEKQSKLETGEPTEPENPPAAVEETEQLPVNGHATDVAAVKETEEPAAAGDVTQEDAEKKAEDSLEKSDMESVAPPEPDESSGKVTDPIVALDAEPENTEQQPVPENNPEPVQMHLAERAPEPEPEKLAESVPAAELQEQALPVPAAAQQPVDAQPPTQEEKVSGKVETEEEPQTTMETKAEEVATETVVVTEDSSEKPAEAAAAAPEKDPSAETGSGGPEQDVKEVDPDESVAVKGAEPAAEAEGVAPEQGDAEPQKAEEAVPASGSLSFALLEQDQTKDALRLSRTLIVLRGLPGSGKSFLARAIADSYKDHCSVISADDHGIKPESPESSADGFKALDEALVASCCEGTASSVLIVVDDTNHTHDRLARLGEIAEEHHLIVIFLEPQTEWSRDLAQLSKKTQRGLKEAQLEAMKAPLEETSLPLYFGWFLLSSVQDKVRCISMDFLKTLDTLDSFKKHMADFTGEAEKEVDLEQFFKGTGILHCTTKFCNYGKAAGAAEYAQNPDVKKHYGSAFELSLTALFVTPRTFGARVSLTEEQLLLWPADDEKQAASGGAASLPVGSRAHVTLGCADGVEPVQTGLDLLQILALQQEGQQGEQVEEMELGSLSYFSEGRWLLTLREPICAPACFSSFYGRKEELEPSKKEPEKKKKLKCAIL